jgi:hypothetical protein
MALMVPDAGEKELLSRATSYEGSKLILYTNAYNCSEGSTVGSFTECAVAGYAAIPLASGSWNVTTSTNITTVNYALQAFNPTTAVTCYGYCVTNSAKSVLLWAETFNATTSSPYVLPAGGGTINVTVSMTVD